MPKKNPKYKSHDYEFGILFHSYRQKAHLTQLELATLVGVSKRALLNWEAGVSYPQHHRLRKLIEIFLEEGSFTPREEHGEAYQFWEKATPTKKEEKDAFNTEWFNKLPHQIAVSHNSSSVLHFAHRQDLSEAGELRVLYGRENEVHQLENWIVDKKKKMVNIFGLGGIGKTGLAINLAHQLKSRFDFVIFRTLRNSPPLDELLESLLRFLLAGQLSNMQNSQNGKLKMVMEYLRKFRCLLILDNLETIMQPELGAGEFREGFRDYAGFLRTIIETPHQSCILVTSRERPHDLGYEEEIKSPVASLTLKGLDQKSCQAVLHNVNININSIHATLLAERYGGNPLALKLVAEPIKEIFEGDIEAFLKSEGFRLGGVTYILDQVFDRLSSIEEDLLYWLALNREPLLLDSLQHLSLSRTGLKNFADGFKALHKRFLVEQNTETAGVSLQEVVMEYVTQRLINQMHEEIIEQRPDLLCKYPILQTQVRNHIRQTQLRIIVEPLLAQIRTSFAGVNLATQHLKGFLDKLRHLPGKVQGYAGGNLLNLLVRSSVDLKGHDLQNLNLWQCYLAEIELPFVNLSRANVKDTVFAEANLSGYSLAFSPDGQQLAVGCSNGVVKLWEVGDLFGRQVLECNGHTNLVTTLAFNSTGTILASGSHDGTIRLWEIESGICLAVLRGGNSSVRSLAFSPGGQLLATSGDGPNIFIWNLTSGRLVNTLAGNQGWVLSLAFHPDGKLLAAGGLDNTINLYDFSSTNNLSTPSIILRGHERWVSSVAFSSDGNMLASGSADKSVRIWSVTSNNCLYSLHQHTSVVMNVAFSPDSDLLASSSVDGDIKFRSLSNPTEHKSLPVSEGAVTALAFNPSGKTIVSSNGENSLLNLWSTRELERLDTLKGYSNFILSMAISPDNSYLVVGGADQHLKLWDFSKPEKSEPISLIGGQAGLIFALAISPDSKTVVSAGSDTTLKLWEVGTGKLRRTFRGHVAQASAVAFSMDNRWLISGDAEGRLIVWSLITGEIVQELAVHHGRIRNVLFSQNGSRFIAVWENGFIQAWHFRSEKGEFTLLTGWQVKSELTFAISTDADGTNLFSGGSDGQIRCWRIPEEEYFQKVDTQKGAIWSLAYNPVKQLLAVGCEDGTIQVWSNQQPDQLELVTCFDHISKKPLVTFAPDGTQLYSAGEGTTIKQVELKNYSLNREYNYRPPYEGLNISRTTGLTPAQRHNLINLGAIESTD